MKTIAAAGRVRGVDRPAVRFDDPPADGQAQPQAGFLRAEKRLEDPLRVAAGKPRPSSATERKTPGPDQPALVIERVRRLPAAEPRFDPDLARCPPRRRAH